MLKSGHSRKQRNNKQEAYHKALLEKFRTRWVLGKNERVILKEDTRMILIILINRIVWRRWNRVLQRIWIIGRTNVWLISVVTNGSVNGSVIGSVNGSTYESVRGSEYGSNYQFLDKSHQTGFGNDASYDQIHTSSTNKILASVKSFKKRLLQSTSIYISVAVCSLVLLCWRHYTIDQNAKNSDFDDDFPLQVHPESDHLCSTLLE